MRCLTVLLSIILFDCGFAGCKQAPKASGEIDSGSSSPESIGNPQLSVLDSELRSLLFFEQALVVRLGRQPIRVDFPVRSLAEDDLTIEYRYTFYDADDEKIEPELSWMRKRLKPMAAANLTVKASDATAQNYRLEVRYPE